ncbi:MAG: hypothetical protein AABZ54_06170 [Bacteroidota bacterium]
MPIVSIKTSYFYFLKVLKTLNARIQDSYYFDSIKILFVLYIAIDLDNFSQGNIYSIVAYLWTFVTPVEYIPELLESKTSLQDLSRRIETDL